MIFAATVVPASLVPFFISGGMEPFAWALFFFCCVAAGDAVCVLHGLRGVSVSFPERLTLVRNREGILRFCIADARNRPLALRLGIELPGAVVSPRNSVSVLLPGSGEGLGVSLPLAASRRGVHAIGRCLIRMRSPLGFWFGQSSLPAGTLIRVYPAFHEENKKLAALFLSRNEMRIRPHRQIGRGREFETLRTYLPGDSQGDIHWKAAARRGHPVTKEFRIERTQEVYCIIDASRLSAREAGDEGMAVRDNLLDTYLSASLLLAVTARRQGDLFGVMIFSDQPLTFLRARRGTVHFSAIREALSTVQASLVAPNFEETASFLAARLRRRALLLFLTSLDEPAMAENFSRSIPVLTRRHLVQVQSVKPACAHPLFSDNGTDIHGDLYQRLGGHLVWHGLRRIRETLRRRGVELSLIERERFCTVLVTRYLTVKRRQIL